MFIITDMYGADAGLGHSTASPRLTVRIQNFSHVQRDSPMELAIPTEIRSFVPAEAVPIELEGADLNGDGLEDALLVLDNGEGMCGGGFG